MKIEGYEEISLEEYNKIPHNEGAYFYDVSTKKSYYFKKVQKFPIVFENENKIINVFEGGIDIIKNNGRELISFDYKQSFPLLVKAVEKAKEVMKK